jgi:hypothetical protein
VLIKSPTVAIKCCALLLTASFFMMIIIHPALAEEIKISILPQTSLASNPPPGPLSESTYTRASYIPSSVCIEVNSKTVWVNNDTRAHTVTETTEKFDSGNITQGKTFSHTFNTTGNYNYFDRNDPKMTGFLKVANTTQECELFTNQTSGF